MCLSVSFVQLFVATINVVLTQTYASAHLVFICMFSPFKQHHLLLCVKLICFVMDSWTATSLNYIWSTISCRTINENCGNKRLKNKQQIQCWTCAKSRKKGTILQALNKGKDKVLKEIFILQNHHQLTIKWSSPAQTTIPK